MSIEKKEIYIAVRNVLANELGINKSIIDEMIAKEITARVEHFFSNTNLKKLIADVIRIRLNENSGVLLGDKWSNYSKTMNQVISERIAEEFSAQIEAKVKKLTSQISISIDKKQSSEIGD